MKFTSQWFLKWIQPGEPLLQGQSFRFINKCILVAADRKNEIAGLTVLEPRDLNADFLQRFQLRQQHPDFINYTFTLYVPEFIKHRVENLSLKANISYTSFMQINFAGAKASLRDRLRVINVDDSPVLLKFLKHSLEALGYVDVVRQISNPHAAVAEILKHEPDIITMDIQMPGKTGVEIVRELVGQVECPIIMVSSLEPEEGSLVFDALNSGAFDYLQKPQLEDRDLFKENLSAKLLVAAESQHGRKNQLYVLPQKTKKVETAADYPKNLIWTLGASTGGTQALSQVFTSLPANIPPTFVVQHIPPVFSKSFADSLNQLCPFTVKEAEDGERAQFNHVYIAPGGFQMGLIEKAGLLYIKISDSEPVNRFKPSVDYLFADVAKLTGYQVVAGLLTGMGKDGANGLLQIKKSGHHTFAQNEETSAVFGMPRAAIELGAAEHVLAIDRVAQTLIHESVITRKAV